MIDGLGAQVISDSPADDTPAVLETAPPTAAPQPQASVIGKPCQWPSGCATGLDDEDSARLGRMRFKVRLCRDHYQQAKAANGVPAAA